MKNAEDMRTYIEGAQRCLDAAAQALQHGDTEGLLERMALVAQYASLVAHYMPPEVKGIESMKNVWSLAAATTNAIRPLPERITT